jgi:Domain of unknown function (DUF4168)
MKYSYSRRTTATLAGVSLAFALSLSCPAHAQQPPTQPPADQAPLEQSTTVDEPTVEKFAAAYKDVSVIQTKAATALRNATTSDQQAQIRDSAEKDARAAVEAKGLAAEEFNRIAQLMLTDDTLRQRVLQKLQGHERA